MSSSQRGRNSQVNVGLNPDYTKRPIYPPSAYTNNADSASAPADKTMSPRGTIDGSFVENVQKLLGKGVVIKQSMSADIDVRQSVPHTTTGLPYALGGTATQVQVEVASWLAGFQDPIKTILGVGVHRDAKIIIKRKYIQGGGAMITPERAPARLVSVQEDVREVNLTRYGGDIEVNLNHFLLPKVAQEEFDMKVNHQKRELERTLVNIGYETLMREGTMLQDAIIRSNPAITDAAQALDAAERITVRMLFGSMAKHAFPVQNILAACKYASAYTVSGRRGSVLVLPHGLPELLRYTKPEKMKYSVSGLTQSQTSKPIDMDLDNVVVDPSTGVRIMTHIPQPTFAVGGVLEPEPSPLQNEVTVRTFYKVKPGQTRILDYQTGAMRVVTFDDVRKLLPENCVKDFNEEEWEAGGDGRSGTNLVDADDSCDPKNFAIKKGVPQRSDVYTLVRETTFMMSSAILAVPGSETGELLFAYPMTGVSTSQTSESMLMKLRVYLGAALYQPEDVMIIPNVAFEGIVQGQQWINEKNWSLLCSQPASRASFTGDDDLQLDDNKSNEPCTPSTCDEIGVKVNLKRAGDAKVKLNTDDKKYAPDHEHETKCVYFDKASSPANGTAKSGLPYFFSTSQFDQAFHDSPSAIYQGATALKLATEATDNVGHLGKLESPEGWNSFWGSCGGNVYSPNNAP